MFWKGWELSVSNLSCSQNTHCRLLALVVFFVVIFLTQDSIKEHTLYWMLTSLHSPFIWNSLPILQAF